jgi:nitrogen PTS system EIIA component
VITIKEAAARLGVSQKIIYQWINSGHLTSHKLGNDLYLEQAQVDKLLSYEGLTIPAVTDEVIDFSLTRMLENGGIFYHVEGTTKQAVIHNALLLIKELDSPDMAPILKMFLSREELYSTGIGNGIAIPHASGILVGHVNQPLISLAFLENPIDYGAIDGKPVHIIFSIISPNVSTHLRILAKLACLLHDPQCKEVIVTEASKEIILQVFSDAEKRLCKDRSKG